MRLLTALLLALALTSPAMAQRIPVTANVTLFVAPASNCTSGYFGSGVNPVVACGNDDTGDGTMPAPFATCQRAVEVLFSQYDFRGRFAPTIQIASAPKPGQFFYPPCAISGRLLGQPGTMPALVVAPGKTSFDIGNYNPFTIQGDPTYPLGAFFVAGDFGFPSNAPAFSITEGAVKLSGLSFDTGSSVQDCIDAMVGSFLDVSDLVFGNCGAPPSSYNLGIGLAWQSTLFITGPIQINGSMSALVQAGASSAIYPNNNGNSTLPITLNSPTFNPAMFIIDNSILYEQGLAFLGCIHGSAAQIVDGGQISVRHDPASC